MRAYYTRGPIQTGRTVDLPHARQRYFCIGLRDRVTRLHTHTGANNYNLLEERGTAEKEAADKRWSVAGREEKGDRTSHSFKKHPTDNTHIPGHRDPQSCAKFQTRRVRCLSRSVLLYSSFYRSISASFFLTRSLSVYISLALPLCRAASRTEQPLLVPVLRAAASPGATII